MYTNRFYRGWIRKEKLKSFEVKIKQSDLMVL